MMATLETSMPPVGGQIDRLRRIAAVTTSPRNLQAFAQIDALTRLSPGWDGYNGVPPNEAALDQAKAFVADLADDIIAPEIEPSGDGEINLVWRSAAGYLEVGFTGCSSFSFFGKTLSEPLIRDFGDVPTAANRLPMKLHGLLRLFVDADMRLRERTAERATLAWAS